MMQLQANKILILSSLLALVACSDELEQKGQTSTPERIPLEATAVLDANHTASLTRAADKDFAEGDKLVAYLRHVTWTGKKAADAGYDADADVPQSIDADKAPLLVTFTTGSSTTWDDEIDDILPFVKEKDVRISSDDTKQASTLTPSTPLYWDDFSNSSIDDTDLRTEGHYLQSYYGYCYNGGEPSVALDVASGVIGWEVQDNQNADNAFMHSDLLWSPEQLPVGYRHAQTERKGLLIPYTHAMSKVTINVTAGEGFDADFTFTNTKVTLKDVRTSCKATAPTATLDYTSSIIDDVEMMTGTDKGTRAFSAIIVPSVLSVGNTLAIITDMDGNKYNIPITEAIVGYDASTQKGWGIQLTYDADENLHHGVAQAPTRASIDGGKGYQMKSGVHYVLNVTVSKTAITVMATIKDWIPVDAEGVGLIQFDPDVTTTGSIDDKLQDLGFDVYQSANVDPKAYAKVTSYTYTDTEWIRDNEIYWPNASEEFYFRALSPKGSSTTVADNLDILWATTPEDEENEYDEGEALKPRTGDVPLAFEHAMTKVSFTLQNAPDAIDAQKVDLTDATIQISNLFNQGTIAIDDGSISDLNTVVVSPMTSATDPTFSGTVNSSYKLNNKIVVPQSLVNLEDGTPRPDDEQVVVIITLKDGTRYTLPLKDCVVKDSETKIETWERGTHYNYVITLSKEQILFQALVKDWDEVYGYGDAILEWD